MNRAFFGLALATLLFAGQAPAQPYPSPPATFIFQYGAGGPVDTLARLLSEPMRTSLGQPVIVENVTGASGTIGVARAVRAAPDGYTVSIGNWPSHVVNGAIYTLPYDVLKDFEPVARLPSNPYVVVARKDLPAANLGELIAWLKANPDKATQGTAGPGSGQHVSGVYFQNATGTRFQFVPYRAGSSGIMREVVAADQGRQHQSGMRGIGGPRHPQRAALRSSVGWAFRYRHRARPHRCDRARPLRRRRGLRRRRTSRLPRPDRDAHPSRQVAHH